MLLEIFRPPKYTDPESERLAIYFYYALIGSGILVILTLLYLLVNQYLVDLFGAQDLSLDRFDLIFNPLLALILFTAAYQIKLNRLKLIINISAVFGVIAIAINNFVLNLGFYDTALLFNFVILNVVSIFFGRKYLSYFTIIIILMVFVSFILEKFGVYQTPNPEPSYILLAQHVGALLLASFFLRVTTTRLSQKNALLNEQNDELEHYKNHLEELVDKRTHALLAEKNRAEQANKVKGQFMAKMSHELRTPLNAIIGYSEILTEELAESQDSSDLGEDSERIEVAGRHLLRLIDDILDFSNIENNNLALNLTDLNLNDLILNEILPIMEPVIKKSDNRLNLQLDSPPVHIHSDKHRLEQILLNLLDNAAKFTQNGTITLTTSIKENEVIINVADTGAGIESNYMQQLFEPFIQADDTLTRKRDGSGLGLAITKELCDLLGGNIDVESQINIGSTFTVRLPLQQAKALA